MVHHHKPVKRLVKVTAKRHWMFVQMISSEQFNLLAKRSTLKHLQEPKCCAEILFCYCQDHSQDPYSQNMISTFSSELLICLQSNLVWSCIKLSMIMHHQSWSALWKYLIAVVKVTVIAQNPIECLSVLYFLYHWYVYNQTRSVDVLSVLLVTRPGGI